MYILSFDQGTTSTMAMVFDKEGKEVSSARLPHEQIYEKPGYVAHNATEIYENIVRTGEMALSKAEVTAQEIEAIGITNQRETVVMWDKETGEPIGDAIVWQCNRSAPIVRRFIEDGMSETIRDKTGLVMDSYFSASKIIWMFENRKKARQKLAEDELLVGTIDSYIIYMLTGEHVTDVSNASRTMLYNIHTKKWDPELLDYFKIPKEILPKVIPSGIDVPDAPMVKEGIFGKPIPITGVLGDQQAALFGQTCFDAGDTKSTYGTGCFILQNIGKTPIITKGPILTTVGWEKNGETYYALEGSLFSAGSAIDWMFHIGLVNSFEELETMLKETPTSDGVYFVPAFNGLGAPHWDESARACFQGITLGTKKEHMVRAVCDSIAYQALDALAYMQQESGIALTGLMVDGGVSANSEIMQHQSDLLGLSVKRPKIAETTCLGAAYMAGLMAGIYESEEFLSREHEIEDEYKPKKASNTVRWRAWQKAVDKSRNWLEE